MEAIRFFIITVFIFISLYILRKAENLSEESSKLLDESIKNLEESRKISEDNTRIIDDYTKKCKENIND